MIYFDNAATTFPKPPQVIWATRNAMSEYGANPGRAGHALSIRTAEAVFDARTKCAEFFGAEVENTMFTLNCTFALNMAIKGVSAPGSHYIISDLEHNAVARPVHAISKSSGITYSIAKTFDDDSATVKSFESLITAKTKAIACTAASNVTGKILPIKKLGELCKNRGICFILDAAQGGGVIPLKLSDGVNIICTSGHKGLYGTMGTGLLITDGKYMLKTYVEGGTGSNSRNLEQPDNLPDRFESGTINTPGVMGLAAGIDFVNRSGMERIHNHERKLCELFIKEVKDVKNVHLPTARYWGENANRHSVLPLVPFNIGNLESSDTTKLLSDAGLCLRGGLHCSFLAHKKIGTLEVGAARFAPSAFNTKKEVMALVRQVRRIAEKQ